VVNKNLKGMFKHIKSMIAYCDYIVEDSDVECQNEKYKFIMLKTYLDEVENQLKEMIHD